ncbi:conserved hypothetical protein [Hyella patelloides LEGE 07179]|uniref:Lantibiotic biosynthesis protein dehydration domain-containing protein n=1 Tax=Hyella patelloides LEGE 07179 TaxID=945734 RepID=A0A563VVY1_9CYAN|nr:type 2 lanthipeptide synthetase LanM family protein [Hyella patelloides]VEP15565.1 conserved hypothetical protein [Hyella patelloides LEGE 07179]
MKVSLQDLIEIVERASIMSDRLSEKFVPDPIQDNQLIETRLEKLIQITAKGDSDKFSKYLQWNNLDLNTLRHSIGKVRCLDVKELPSWVETLKAVLQATVFPLDVSDCKCLNPQQPFPFEEIIISFVKVAREKLLKTVGINYQILTEEAGIQLERNLLQRLSSLAASPLDLEFSLFRYNRGGLGLDCLTQQLSKTPPRTKYQKFIEELLQGRLLSFFQEYSVLARLMATVTNFWVDSVGELITRLSDDWKKIQTTFAKDRQLEQVVALKLSLSDSHNCGRSVIGIKFNSGLKLVYKPKGLGIDRAYFELLSWLNQQHLPLQFQIVKILNCNTYGWMEYVESKPCQESEQTQRYYQRLGMLLSIIYLLRGTDCHYENLIGCGEQPILIDLETLLLPKIDTFNQGNDAEVKAQQELQESVLQTHLLPQWQVTGKGEYFNISPIKAISESEIPQQITQWQHINSDCMSLVTTSVRSNSANQFPSSNQIDASPEDYVEEIVTGFRQMYDFLLRGKNALLADNSPLTNFFHQKVRLVFRNTRVYASLLNQSVNPKWLRDGIDRSIQLDIIGRTFINGDTKHPYWKLIAAEQEALERLDIPYFSAYSDSINLPTTRGSILGFATESGYSAVIDRLQKLDEQDLKHQISLIRGSFYSATAKDLHDPQLATKSPSSWDKITPFSGEVMVETAIAIAQELEKSAITGTNSSVTWLGMNYLHQVQRFQIQPLNCYSLSQGSCGVALFLSAVARVTNKQQFHDLALKALSPLQNLLVFDSVPKAEIARELGSLVYGLTLIGGFLNNSDVILKQAVIAASLIETNYEPTEPNLELIERIPEEILGLLTLYKVIGDSNLLVKALDLGAYLHRVILDYSTKKEQPLSINLLLNNNLTVYAFRRLYEVTKKLIFSPVLQIINDKINDKHHFSNRTTTNSKSFDVSRSNVLEYSAIC